MCPTRTTNTPLGSAGFRARAVAERSSPHREEVARQVRTRLRYNLLSERTRTRINTSIVRIVLIYPLANSKGGIVSKCHLKKDWIASSPFTAG